MDFGKVDNIDAVDFSLPSDHRDTQKLFSKLKPQAPVEATVYVGCAKWGRKDWVGRIYPKGTKEKDYLAHYAKSFNTVELNATFYNIPKDDWVERWAADVPEGFKFFPKINQVISHRQYLRNSQEMTNTFLRSMDLFGDKLGAIFLQLNDKFTPKRAEDLINYLRQFPKTYELTVEFRHPAWFVDEPEVNDVYAMMQELGIGTVITDTAGRRDVCHMRLTSPSAFIRYVGNGLHPTDYQRIDAWVERMDLWMRSGLRNVYFFMHQHDELDSPRLCAYLIEKMNAKSGLSLLVPKLLDNNTPSLF